MMPRLISCCLFLALSVNAFGQAQTNPDISLIGDVRAWYDSEGPRNIDLGLQELETSYRSVIDPYARADIYIGIGQHDGEFEFELEEAYLTSLSLPYQLQIKAGKFRSNVGKINQIHPHALPFIDTPAVYANFFGDEGLNDQGLSLNWLVPNARFYQELTVEMTRGPGESESFVHDEDSNRMMMVGHLKNFWDLSDDASLELGLSGINGMNGLGETSTIAGVDVTYKRKPLRYNTYHSFTLQVEVFRSWKDTGGSTITADGLYAMTNYQLARRWFAVGRFDHSDLPDNPDWNEKAVSATLGWHLSEFQKLEWGARHSWGPDLDASWQGLVRAIFVIGTHGAHEY